LTPVAFEVASTAGFDRESRMLSDVRISVRSDDHREVCALLVRDYVRGFTLIFGLSEIRERRKGSAEFAFIAVT